jgi:hypothetical protein
MIEDADDAVGRATLAVQLRHVGIDPSRHDNDVLLDHHHDPAHRLLREQDPLVRLKLKKLPNHPSGPLNEPRARAIGTQNIATPMKRTWRTHQQHSGLADHGGLKTRLL